MKTTVLSRLLASVAAAAIMLSVPRLMAQQYNVRDLGDLGAPLTFGAGLNAAGISVGAGALANGRLNALLNDHGQVVGIAPRADDTLGWAFDVNAAGQVAVASFDYGELTVHGLLWQGGAVIDLGDFAPRAINAGGVMAGNVSLLVPDFGWVDRAARWQAGATTTLATLGGSAGYASAIDDAGQVVGWSYTTNDAAMHATLWRGGTPIDLGTLGGANSLAYAITDQGDIVGVSDTVANLQHAFLYSVDANGLVTARIDLGALAGGDNFSHAFGANSNGAVVGTSDSRAFLWNGGPMLDLNTHIPSGSGWQLVQAWAINDSGQIVGTGVRNGFPRAFLLTPIVVGDLNCDGAINNFDIDPFVMALIDPAAYATGFPGCEIFRGDINGDGLLNNFDIDPFVTLLIGR